MNLSDCARNWAKQSKPCGKASSMFFDGASIYSFGHHYEIARHAVLKDSKRHIILHNSDYYSHSTNRHCRAVWRAAAPTNSGVERDDQHYIEGDAFDTVKTEASLRAAVKLTKQHKLDRAYEARVYRNEQARRDREHNADTARQELESALDLDLTEMSGSFAVQLRNLLHGVPDNNFRCGRSWSRGGQRRGGLLEQAPTLAEFLHDILPERIKQPGEVLTLIENFKQLAA